MEKYPERPVPAVAALVIKEEKVLMVQRGNPPAENLWALPGGKVRLAETMAQAVEREVLEETGIKVRAGEPILAIDAIYRDEKDALLFHYVIVYYRAVFISGGITPGDDVRDARWLFLEDLKDIDVERKTLEIIKKAFRNRNAF
jgi:ADP-ribose pyrophosphatase